MTEVDEARLAVRLGVRPAPRAERYAPIRTGLTEAELYAGYRGVRRAELEP